jgi:uncharacterized protein YukE
VEPTADPAALDAAARALRQVAQNLDAGGSVGAFARQASGSRWTGKAARQFQTSVSGDASKATSLAGELRAIAGLIEDGARRVRQIRAAQAKALADQQTKSNAPAKPLASYPH